MIETTMELVARECSTNLVKIYKRLGKRMTIFRTTTSSSL